MALRVTPLALVNSPPSRILPCESRASASTVPLAPQHTGVETGVQAAVGVQAGDMIHGHAVDSW